MFESNCERAMSDSEKVFGKSIEDMSFKEFREFTVFEENNKKGTLEGYDCPKCKNKGYIALSWNVVKPCDCRKYRKVLAEIAKNGLNNSFSKCTLESFRVEQPWQKTAKSTAERFVGSESGSWFFFGGQVGCGKTHLCSAVFREVMLKTCKSGRYMVWDSEITLLNGKVNSEEFERTMKELIDIDILYIDDFFKTISAQDKPTAGEIKRAKEIINGRYINGKTTIISSERSINEIIKIDEAVGSRIFEKVGEFSLYIKPDFEKNMRLNGDVSIPIKQHAEAIKIHRETQASNMWWQN